MSPPADRLPVPLTTTPHRRDYSMAPGDRYSAPAVDAALSILETLGSVHEVSLTELARKVGVGKSSVFRQLMTLARRGYREDRQHLLDPRH